MTQGVLNRFGGIPAGVGYLQTTAGDWELEAKPRRHNALEAIGLYTFLMAVQWPFCYVFGTWMGNSTVQTIAWFPIVAGAVYLLVASPFLHRDSLESWGLGNPRTLWRMLNEGPAWKRAALAATVLAILLALNWVNYLRWEDVAKFFNFHKTPIRDFHTHWPGRVFVFGFGMFLSSLIVLFGIRYDNFGSAFKTAMWIALPLFFLICLGAWVQRGWEAFSVFDPVNFTIAVLGYLFWGFTQQLLFSSYFGTRLRKAFGPSTSAGNVVAAGRRLPVTLGFGLGIAGVAAPGMFLGIRWIYGAEEVPPVTLLWFFAFLLPLGALYGHFWCRDRKRLLVATLTGSFFAFIHIESYGLVAATFVLGVVLCYVFMEDRNRNLVALGFIHGLLGSTLGWLFSKGQSGALEIDYRVGPWNVDDPALGVVAFPMLVIAVYLGILFWCARNLPATPPSRKAPEGV